MTSTINGRNEIDNQLGTETWLSVELSSSGDTCILTLDGYLTGTSIAALQAQIDQIGCTNCRDIVLDVSRLLGIDHRGEGLLYGLYHYATARGGELRFVGASGQLAVAIHDCLLRNSDLKPQDRFRPY